MGVTPKSVLLFDATSSINRFIDDFIWVYVLLILAYIITSWVRLPYSPWLRRIQEFLRDVCEPYLRLFRRLLPSFGPLDLSPVIAIFFLFLLMRVVDALFGRFD
jgi:YggT family protein